MLYVGTRFEYAERPTARQRIDSAGVRQFGPCCCVPTQHMTLSGTSMCYYVLPAVYADTRTCFSEEHRSRIEELAHEDQPRVCIKASRAEVAPTPGEGSGDDAWPSGHLMQRIDIKFEITCCKVHIPVTTTRGDAHWTLRWRCPSWVRQFIATSAEVTPNDGLVRNSRRDFRWRICNKLPGNLTGWKFAMFN